MNVMMLTQSALLPTTESVVTQMVLTVVTAYQVMLRVFPMEYVEVIIIATVGISTLFILTERK